jgi:PKD repeat protein
VREHAAASRPPARAALIGLVVALALLGAAPNAWGVVVHLRNGKALSFQPLRGASESVPADAFFSNLDYNGGPVMPSNTNYAVYWRPSSAPAGTAYPSDYQAGVDRYFEDLAHDSGGHENTDSVSSQYNDWEGDYARYESHFGRELLDTDPYPANGCKAATICLTDEQLQHELAKFIAANKLPADLQHEYFLLTPPKVEDCFEAGGSECSAGSSKPRYCAYHSAFNSASGVVVYSNDPYVTGNPGCDDGNHPNGKTSDGVIEGGLSHEHNESITDPQPNNGWADLSAGGSENGDKCRTFESSTEFGTPLGTTESGAEYNQVIDGHPYWYQQEWSNEEHKCLQRWTPAGAPATATFSSEPAGTSEMKFNAAGSTAPGGVVRYNWRFGREPPKETSIPTITYKFAASGQKLEVALTVFAANGESAGTARLIQTGDEGPTSAFAPAASATMPGEAMTFEAGASTDPDGSITSYQWNFGDGSPGASGVSPSHAFAAAGTYAVTLRIRDATGQIATATHLVEVDEMPTAEFSFSPITATAGSAVSFNGAASSDPDGSIASFSWSFGDGASASGVAPEHAFSSPGTYPVTLTVTDSAGRHATSTHAVTVGEAPPPEAPLAGASTSTVAGLAGYGSATGGSGTGGQGAVAASSGFTSTASVDPASGTITFAASVAGSGTFSWVSTFANGRFGVFAARSSNKCRKGFIKLQRKCGPPRIVFSKGSKQVASAGLVKLTLIPNAAGRRALAIARRRKRGLPVTVTVTFRPRAGGAPVRRKFSIVVSSRARRP